MVHFALSVVLVLCSAHWSTAAADLSAFVAAVGFDEEANLDWGMGFGVRWGKSTSLIGGETSLMVARPTRQLQGGEETATALFYEGRLLVNIPTGTAVHPFVGVGFGMITLTSTDVPTNSDEVLGDALGAVADAQTNKALSYGGGARYALGESLNLRLDLRRYSVFSVKALAARAVQDRIADETGVELPGNLVKDKTVEYDELSLGVVFSF